MMHPSSRFTASASVLEQYAFENGQPFDQEVVDDSPLLNERLAELQCRQWLKEHGDGLRDVLEASGYPESPRRMTVNGKRRSLAWPARYRQRVRDVLVPEADHAFPKTKAELEAQVKERRESFSKAIGPFDANRLEESDFYSGYGRLNVNKGSRDAKQLKIVMPREFRFAVDCAANVPTLKRFDQLEAECDTKAFKDARFGGLRIEKWNKDGPNPDACPHIEPVIAAIEAIESALQAQSAHLASHTIRALQTDAAAFKSEHGQLSFDDMIVRLDAALTPEENPAAGWRRSCGGGSSVVDEFQDTDPIQWSIFRRVFVEGWPAGLMVIGDPKQAIYARELELEEVLQAALGPFASAAVEAGVTLRSRFDPRLPTVKGDPAKLRQAFGNLISNAIKFTPPGGIAAVEACVDARRFRLGARARYGPRHDTGRDRGCPHAVRPSRCQSLALARGHGARPADSQGARAAARRSIGDSQQQVA